MGKWGKGEEGKRETGQGLGTIPDSPLPFPLFPFSPIPPISPVSWALKISFRFLSISSVAIRLISRGI